MEWLYIWVGVLVVSVIIEAASMQLMTIWFAIGAVCAWIASVAGGPVWLQLCIFAGVSVLMLILTRPIALKYLKPKREPTNADAVPGKEGVVVADVKPIEGIGQIKVGGQIWSAKPEDGTEVIPVGTRVKVLRIEGVKAVIRVLDQNEF